ncbi:disks large-associated 5 [Pelobates cultripes]|nr:disks large-associated 5 [Pelobates cultripes]
MDVGSKFTNRYKKDLSLEALKAKIVRRKSITQKENRYKEFRKTRGLTVRDENISDHKVYHSILLEEDLETSSTKVLENKNDLTMVKEQLVNQQREKLERYKEEKLLRKLKEQRQNARKAPFKCGIYKHEDLFSSLPDSLDGTKIKPKEKSSTVTSRVTRSAAKTELAVNKTTRRQPVMDSSRIIEPKSRGCGKGNTTTNSEKENQDVLPGRLTRATASKVLQKNTNVTAAKPQKKGAKVLKPPGNKVEHEIVAPSNKEQKSDGVLKNTSTEEKGPAARERIPSFAPDDFMFQPLDGLPDYKLQPMTPCRANRFLTSRFAWSPIPSERNNIPFPKQENEGKILEHVTPNKQNHEPVIRTPVNPSHQETETAVHEPALNEQTHSQADNVCAGSLPSPADEPQHDVTYFRDTLKSQIQRLTLLISQWEGKIENDIPEEAKDLIRTTVGQSRLLMSERFKQFEGLVDNCEFKRGEKETTCTDLDGFWDMVYFQIEDVLKKFASLEKLEENSWQQNKVQTQKILKKKIVPASSVKESQGDNGRSAARSRLAAIKAAMKNKLKSVEPIPEELPSELPTQVDQVVFDAGFFRVESPAKLPNDARASRRSFQTSATPKTAINPLLKSSSENDATLQCGGQSQVGKVLFENAVEVGVAQPEKSEVNLVKCLVPSEACFLECGQSTSSEDTTPLNCRQRETYLAPILMYSPIEDEVFTPKQNVSSVLLAKPLPEECKTDETFDFLVHHAPLKFDAVPSDLIVFSPLQN